MNDVTRLLNALEAGAAHAGAQLLPLVYDELRRLAAVRLAAESSDHTLQPTALVHEAYLRLVGTPATDRWDHRGHFFAAAAEAMRRILVEAARRRAAHKHGGALQRVPLPEFLVAHRPDSELLEVDDLLEQLAAHDPTAAELVKLHVFVGLTVEQAGEVLGLSARTAYRNWSYARAWLFRRLTPE